ncbi:MAG TPA: hypothetical protein VJ808_01325 [Gemmatimonadales bacterium]|nr:hypothetical protein [Gemmatimonadales bacterium]
MGHDLRCPGGFGREAGAPEPINEVWAIAADMILLANSRSRSTGSVPARTALGHGAGTTTSR